MLIFVFGEDQFNAKEKVRVMREAFLEKFDASGTNLAEFPLTNQKKLELGNIAQAIQSPPFLSTKRMVVIKGILGEVTRKPESKPWIELFERVPESTIVIVYDEVSSAKAKKHAMVSGLSGSKDVHEYIFDPMSESQAVNWVLGEVKKEHISISPALARVFVGMAGVDTWMLHLELQKLASFCKGREVTQKDLELMVRPSADDQLFTLLDAMSQRNQVKLKKLLIEQRLFGTPDAQLFGMLVRQIRLLIAASDYVECHANASGGDMAKGLGVHPFVAKKLFGQQGHFSKQELIELQEKMLKDDLLVKTGVLRADQAVDLSIVPFSGANG